MRLLLLLALPALARAQTPPAYQRIDSLMRAFTEREHVPGAAWGIIIDGKLVHIAVAGYRDVATKSPVDSNTVFRIASMTKSFTAMSILKLRDEGKLALDDPAETYVPELKSLKYPTTDSPKITIRHLLSHAEGFPEDNPWGDQQLARTDAEMSAMMKAGIPFSNAPGLAHEYSNYGFAILGRIVQNVSRQPYATYVRENILKPLGMHSTTLEPRSVAPGRLAHGYRWEDQTWKEEPQLPDGAFGAMGGMLTSLHDLGLYVGALLGAFPARDGPELGPIRRASLREMQQLSRAGATSVRYGPSGASLNSGGYGFGLRVAADCNFGYVVSHSGGLPGFGTQMRWLPEYGVGIIAFGNRTYTGWTGVINEALVTLAHPTSLPRQPVPDPRYLAARESVTRLMIAWEESLARSIAADNLFLDRTIDRRAAELTRMRDEVGPCTNDVVRATNENALRGTWILRCQRGSLQGTITLAPSMPPTVQYMEFAASKTVEPRYANSPVCIGGR